MRLLPGFEDQTRTALESCWAVVRIHGTVTNSTVMAGLCYLTDIKTAPAADVVWRTSYRRLLATGDANGSVSFAVGSSDDTEGAEPDGGYPPVLYVQVPNLPRGASVEWHFYAAHQPDASTHGPAPVTAELQPTPFVGLRSRFNARSRQGFVTGALSVIPASGSDLVRQVVTAARAKVLEAGEDLTTGLGIHLLEIQYVPAALSAPELAMVCELANVSSVSGLSSSELNEGCPVPCLAMAVGAISTGGPGPRAAAGLELDEVPLKLAVFTWFYAPSTPRSAPV